MKGQKSLTASYVKMATAKREFMMNPTPLNQARYAQARREHTTAIGDLNRQERRSA